MSMPVIPRIMSTQHPDNVYLPPFVQNQIMSADDELREALFCYKNLGCDEQKWDAEGKEADTEILDSIFASDHAFFRKHQLGKHERLTFRIPNPRLEPHRQHTLAQMLEAIPRLHDIAKMYYQSAPKPVYEIILPQAESAAEILQVQKMCPPQVTVIPLFESIEKIVRSHTIVEKILKITQPEYQRVYLARSDPALQSGMIAAVLGVKIGLARLYQLSKKIEIPIYPIIGVGGSAFRGHFTPNNALNVFHEYRGVATLTAQSSFKFDFPEKMVREAIAAVKKEKMEMPVVVPEKKLLELITRLQKGYQAEMKKAIPLLMAIAPYVPRRRQRFLHADQKGYGRGFNGHPKQSLPRAIGFTAALYSVGLPPELFGIQAITQSDALLLDAVYPTWRFDVSAALSYVNTNTAFGHKLAQTAAQHNLYALDSNNEHGNYSTYILRTITHKKITPRISEVILEAAKIRNFLG